MSRTVFVRILLCAVAFQSDGFSYIGSGLICANVGYHGNVAKLLVAILVVERKNPTRHIVGGKIARNDILDDVIALFAGKHEQSLTAISVLQRQSSAYIHRNDGNFASVYNRIDLLRLGAEIISAVHRGLKEASLLNSGNEFVVSEEALMSVGLAKTAGTRGCGGWLLHSVGIHKTLRHGGLATTGRADKTDYTSL